MFSSPTVDVTARKFLREFVNASSSTSSLKSKSLLDRIGLCYEFENRISRTDEVNIVSLLYFLFELVYFISVYAFLVWNAKYNYIYLINL